MSDEEKEVGRWRWGAFFSFFGFRFGNEQKTERMRRGKCHLTNKRVVNFTIVPNTTSLLSEWGRKRQRRKKTAAADFLRLILIVGENGFFLFPLSLSSRFVPVAIQTICARWLCCYFYCRSNFQVLKLYVKNGKSRKKHRKISTSRWFASSLRSPANNRLGSLLKRKFSRWGKIIRSIRWKTKLHEGQRRGVNPWNLTFNVRWQKMVELCDVIRMNARRM